MSSSSLSSLYLNSIKIHQWIFTIFGLNLPPPLYSDIMNSPRKYLTFSAYIVYCAYLISIASYGFYGAYVHSVVIHYAAVKYQLDSITKFTGYIQNASLVVIYSFIELKTVVHHNELRKIFDLIALLEDEILTHGNRKKTSLKWHLFRVLGLFHIILGLLLLYVTYHLFAWDLAFGIKITLAVFTVGMQMKCFEYGIYIQIINELIDCLWASMRSLKEDIENCPRSKGQCLPWSLVKQLMKHQQILNRVWFSVSRIERYFAWPILLIFFYNAIAVLSTANWAYVRQLYELKSDHQLQRYVFIIVLLLNLLILCCLTEKCMKKYCSIATLLYKFKLQPQDSDVLMCLREFSMQLMHQKLNFTCSGYLDLDFRGYGKMLLVISAYLIILIQFKMEDKSQGVIQVTRKIFGKRP